MCYNFKGERRWSIWRKKSFCPSEVRKRARLWLMRVRRKKMLQKQSGWHPRHWIANLSERNWNGIGLKNPNKTATFAPSRSPSVNRRSLLCRWAYLCGAGLFRQNHIGDTFVIAVNTDASGILCTFSIAPENARGILFADFHGVTFRFCYCINHSKRK